MNDRKLPRPLTLHQLNQVDALIADQKRRSQPFETAPLDRRNVETTFDVLRRKLTGVVGITLVQDHNGAWGQAGLNYLTLRFNDPDGDGLITVQTVVQKVSHAAEDDRHNRELRATPK